MTMQFEEKLHKALNDLAILHTGSEKAVLAQHGLRRVRFYVLRHLYQNPGLPVTRLSELSLTGPASISRMVYSMEEEGLVQREQDENDRRKSILSLTDAGKALYEKANTALQADIRARFSSIDEEQFASSIETIEQLVGAIKQHQHNEDLAT
ncbi:MAG: putative Organic hydroperoxide resistance transcriptional regulator [Candidatus Thorarchaeota archaeon]|nr:MAG: putative Organic hydroperoxide resistance transcriptional regulator [Candidatus Thorarchaeota archaeon]